MLTPVLRPQRRAVLPTVAVVVASIVLAASACTTQPTAREADADPPAATSASSAEPDSSEPAPEAVATVPASAVANGASDWIAAAGADGDLLDVRFIAGRAYGPERLGSEEVIAALDEEWRSHLPTTDRWIGPRADLDRIDVYSYEGRVGSIQVEGEGWGGAAVSSDGRRVGYTSSDNLVRIASLETGEVDQRLELRYQARHLWFAPGDRYLLVAGGNPESDDDSCCFTYGNVHVFDLDSGEEIDTLVDAEPFFVDRIEPVFSADGSMVSMYLPALGAMGSWSVSTASLRQEVYDSPYWQSVPLASPFSPSGALFVRMIDRDDVDNGRLQVVEAATDEVLMELQPNVWLAFDPADRLLATWSASAEAPELAIDLHDITTGEVIRTFGASMRPHDPDVEDYLRYNIKSLEFSPDGRYLLTAISNGQVIVWSVESGDVALHLDFPDELRDGPVYPSWWAGFSPTGDAIIATGDWHTVLWTAPG